MNLEDPKRPLKKRRSWWKADGCGNAHSVFDPHGIHPGVPRLDEDSKVGDEESKIPLSEPT